jgi:hypothetical protein
MSLRICRYHWWANVYDGLAARIEKCVAFLGPANCGCSEPWEWSATE